MNKKESQKSHFSKIEIIIVGLILLFFVIKILPIFMSIPNKAIISEVHNYISKMNQQQQNHYLKNQQFVARINFLEFDFGFRKENGKPDGKLIKVYPQDSIDRGYVTLGTEPVDFFTPDYNYISYNLDKTAWNLAQARQTYNFGNVNPFFWVKMPRLKDYVGVVIVNNAPKKHLESWFCSLDYPRKIPQKILEGDIQSIPNNQDHNICKVLEITDLSSCHCNLM